VEATGAATMNPIEEEEMSKDYGWALIKPGEGEKLGSMQLKARASQLGMDFSVMQATVEPHQLLAPHTHTHEDQAVFIIDGELEFEVGGEGGTRFTATKGSYVIKPRRVMHCFWNKTDKTCHYIELSGRDGFEGFVDSTADGAMQASIEAGVRFGVQFHYDRIPGLLKKHGLTSVAGMDMPTEGMSPPPWHKER
jgi:quercetin dioxygenase-like cupin family protein